MGPRPKNWCQTVVLKAIRVAVPAFQHSCTCTAHKALKIHGSLIDEYCTAKNGTKTTTTLIPDQYYSICYRMKTQVIDDAFKKRDREAAAAAAATNNNTNAASNNTNAATPGVVGGIMLPAAPANMVLKQEGAAEIAASTGMSNDRIMIHDHFTNINNNDSSITTNTTSTSTTTGTAASMSRYKHRFI